MRVLVLCFDPIAEAVGPFAAALARAGHTVHVLSAESAATDALAPAVALAVPVAGDELAPVDPATVLAATGGPPDVIHAHGRATARAAVALKRAFDVPLVATFAVTEAGRHGGTLPGPASRAAHAVESWLAAQAGRVFVPAPRLAREVGTLFDVPPSRLHVAPVGLDVPQWTAPPGAVAAARLRFAGEGSLVAYHGPLVPGCGVADLLAALPLLRGRHPGTHAVIAGDGPLRVTLTDQIRALKLRRAVSLTGELDDTDLAAVFGAADAVVLPGDGDAPSVRQASALVALRAAAAGTPVLVAAAIAGDTIVRGGVTGVTFTPRPTAPLSTLSAQSAPAMSSMPATRAAASAGAAPAADAARPLADAVSAVLVGRGFARGLAERAHHLVRRWYTWDAIAARAVAAYAEAVAGHAAFERERAEVPLAHGVPVVPIPPGNLLAGLDGRIEPGGGAQAQTQAVPSADFDLAGPGGGPDWDDALAAVGASADAAWQAGVEAARSAVREQARLGAGSTGPAGPPVLGEADDPFDVVLAAIQRR